MTATLTRTDYATAHALAQRLLDGARRDGGATLDPGTGAAPTDGYMVGIAGRGMILHDLESVELAATPWVAYILPTLAPGECLGSWVGDDGHVYLDVSANVADLDAAVALAQRTGELAIWDVAAAREIRTAA